LPTTWSEGQTCTERVARPAAAVCRVAAASARLSVRGCQCASEALPRPRRT
jgi:hypothetical protein